MQKLDRCSADPEGTAQAYLLEDLPRNEARAFQEHCTDCPRCEAIMRHTAEYVIVMKRAARRLRDSGKQLHFG
jgi:anti-sigma factor RsiW